jgi:hypothetical protein
MYIWISSNIPKKEIPMAPDEKGRKITVDTGLVGSIWFIGWLFTWAFAKLIGWQILFAIIIWPYYVGLAAH